MEGSRDSVAAPFTPGKFPLIVADSLGKVSPS